MRLKWLLGVALTLGLATATQAAVPAAPLHGGQTATPVAGGCGPGWYRGPYGGCRQGYYPAPGYYRPPGYFPPPPPPVYYAPRCYRGYYGWVCR